MGPFIIYGLAGGVGRVGKLEGETEVCKVLGWRRVILARHVRGGGLGGNKFRCRPPSRN